VLGFVLDDLVVNSETPRPQGGASKTILTALETFLPHDDT